MADQASNILQAGLVHIISQLQGQLRNTEQLVHENKALKTENLGLHDALEKMRIRADEAERRTQHAQRMSELRARALVEQRAEQRDVITSSTQRALVAEKRLHELGEAIEAAHKQVE